MSGRETRGAILGALVWLAFAVPFGVRADEGELRARRIFEAFGVERDLQGVAEAALASIPANAESLPHEDAVLLRSLVAAGFDPQRLARRALAAFSPRCEDAHALDALAWLERPETRVLLGRASLAQALPGAAAEHVSSERDVLLVGFDRRIGSAARGERHAALVLAAMLRAANPMLPSFQRYSPGEIESLLASQRREAARRYEADATLRARYAGIGSDELAAGIRFLRSPSGRWLQLELDRALGGTLVRAAEATAAALVNAFGDRVPAAPQRTASAALE